MVTGGAGFAGGYIVRALLDRGCEVVVFDLAPFREESRFVIGDGIKRVAFEQGSIDNFPRVLEVVRAHAPWGIAHVGGNMDLGFLDRNPMVALKTNVEGAVNIYEAARLFGVQSVVFVSSIAVSARRHYEPIDSNHPVIQAASGPWGAYGAAKVASEAFAYAYRQSFGLNVRIVRPSALYGFGMSWFAPNFMKQIVEPAVMGEPVRLDRGAGMPRDYIHAKDFASLVFAVLSATEGADCVFYAATGEPLRTGGDVGAIVRQLVPGAVVEIGDVVTEADRKELAFRGRISIENARSQLGWAPVYDSLEAGVAEYIERFRAFLAAGGVPTPRPVLTRAPGT
jgi:nucleoside-diphosphate-sugar epimerase